MRNRQKNKEFLGIQINKNREKKRKTPRRCKKIEVEKKRERRLKKTEKDRRIKKRER
jgi:hypothetical protein